MHQKLPAMSKIRFSGAGTFFSQTSDLGKGIVMESPFVYVEAEEIVNGSVYT